MQVLIRRAKDVGVITDAKYKSLCVRVSQLGYRKNEPYPLEPEQPRVLKWIMDQYLGGLGYSVSELSRVALCHESHFRCKFLDEVGRLRII